MQRYDIYASTRRTTSWGEPCVVAGLDVKEREEGEWVKFSELPEIELPFLYPAYRQEVVAVLEAAGLKVKPYGN